MHNGNRIKKKTELEAERNTGAVTKSNHFNCPPFSSRFPPLEVPQVSLRVTVSAPLWEVRTSHWMNPVSFISRGSRHHCERKQNWKNNTIHAQARLPNLIYTPNPPASSEAGMLDQFVIQQPHHSKPLSTLALSYPNLVLRLLKVHAAAHPSVCPYPNVGFRHISPPHSFTPAPKDKAGQKHC